VHDALPPGPGEGVLVQTVRMHRDPLGLLREAQQRFGDVFTLRLATARPIVVVTAPREVAGLLDSDPGGARAGEARRRVLPMASDRSIFGGDGQRHASARGRVAAAFSTTAVAGRRDAMVAIAERHAEAWPRQWPLRALPRMRALVDDVFVRLLMCVADERRAQALTVAIRRMLWTPGNPPLSIPGEGDGLLGAVAGRAFKRRIEPLAALLAEEIDERRGRDTPGEDVIGLMVSSADAPVTELVDELIPLLMAAQEPAAASLAWLLDRLAHSPDVAERFAVAADESVIDETLRLRPPAIAALRRLTAPREVAGHLLPAGVTVMVPIPALHRDPRLYEDPDAFRAARWSSGPPPEGSYLPFGGGARGCLGEHLARAYLHAVVPALLRGRRLRPILREPESMVLRGTILVPRRSVPLRATGY
jgi:cytochrome P450 family 135